MTKNPDKISKEFQIAATDKEKKSSDQGIIYDLIYE